MGKYLPIEVYKVSAKGTHTSENHKKKKLEQERIEF